jgi:hypothetical protein
VRSNRGEENEEFMVIGQQKLGEKESNLILSRYITVNSTAVVKLEIPVNMQF